MAKRFDYFETLESLSDFAVREAEMLLATFNGYDSDQLPELLVRMHELENAADSQIHQIFMHLATEFITPIDREDILSIGQRLDDIVDYIEDVLQFMHMYNVQEIYQPSLTLAGIILEQAKVLKLGLSEFGSFRKSNKMVRKHIVEVNDLEEEADKVYAEAMNRLFREHTDKPLFVMVWSDLFARLERVTDACESVADMMDTIILKNS